jgi:hypothetical protein
VNKHAYHLPGSPPLVYISVQTNSVETISPPFWEAGCQPNEEIDPAVMHAGKTVFGEYIITSKLFVVVSSVDYRLACSPYPTLPTKSISVRQTASPEYHDCTSVYFDASKSSLLAKKKSFRNAGTDGCATDHISGKLLFYEKLRRHKDKRSKNGTAIGMAVTSICPNERFEAPCCPPLAYTPEVLTICDMFKDEKNVVWVENAASDACENHVSAVRIASYLLWNRTYTSKDKMKVVFPNRSNSITSPFMSPTSSIILSSSEIFERNSCVEGLDDPFASPAQSPYHVGGDGHTLLDPIMLPPVIDVTAGQLNRKREFRAAAYQAKIDLDTDIYGDSVEGNVVLEVPNPVPVKYELSKKLSSPHATASVATALFGSVRNTTDVKPRSPRNNQLTSSLVLSASPNHAYVKDSDVLSTQSLSTYFHGDNRSSDYRTCISGGLTDSSQTDVSLTSISPDKSVATMSPRTPFASLTVDTDSNPLTEYDAAERFATAVLASNILDPFVRESKARRKPLVLRRKSLLHTSFPQSLVPDKSICSAVDETLGLAPSAVETYFAPFLRFSYYSEYQQKKQRSINNQASGTVPGQSLTQHHGFPFVQGGQVVLSYEDSVCWALFQIYGRNDNFAVISHVIKYVNYVVVLY